MTTQNDREQVVLPNIGGLISIEDNPVADAARRLASLKYDIDTIARKAPENIPSDLHGPAAGGEYGPHFGSDFLSSILPFLPREFSNDKQVVMNVPTDHILGCSWRVWPDPNISTIEKDEVIDYIYSESGIIDTFYTYIPELSLFLAGEGKNRVNFCRYHNIPHIPARVMIKNYPEANRIKIFTLNMAWGTDVWAVLDDRFIKKVSHFAYALPMLRAYGVSILDVWPEEWPSALELVSHSVDIKNNSGLIDIKLVIDRINITEEVSQYNAQSDRCGLWRTKHSIKNVIFFAIGAMLSGVVVYETNRTSNDILNTASMAIMAFASGVLFMAIAPIIKCSRSDLASKFQVKGKK
ncbi:MULTISPECIES: hypothetical protein [Vibrio]|uniref:Uncharacterized protein n=1 Tax=Vibrio tasmaniensis TaxID=212663 RepID=A0A2N7NCT7_9VIBR|nr:hypothetical protein [Vibrio tasmaniensis]PMO89811.1 hypothetical protein BCT01_00585 [Vibrio tasmaniensis]PMP10016.1 hypothetical protein BCS92_02505 [Vibrio tasmaniensis]TKG32601.1 hypothetical protein FC057_12350 [Vibrio tasmaniensis]TKG41716.1 hypothetical protein FC063_07590 [Vibrio tasmaniensis]TKG52071.1 hypothetical protein FC070_09860 [Vibrio tasmaniensis]